MNKLIKSFHFADNKLSPEWCKEVANHIVYHAGCQNLLSDKKIDEIEQYATGNIDMKPYMRQFKSTTKKLKKATTDAAILESLNNAFIPLALIPVKINSAAHLIYKVGLEPEVKALDSYADEKIERDIKFLKNREVIQAIAQDLADQLSQGNTDVGGTKNSAVEYKKIPFDLDLSDPFQLKVFKEVIYKLQPEAAYEVILRLIYEIKKINGVDLLEIYDDLKYGVRTNVVYPSGLTSIPQVDYVHPSQVYAPKSYYADFRDNSERYRRWYPTVSEMYNMFPNEIEEKDLHEILNGEDGYTVRNGLRTIESSNYDSTQVELIQIFVISLDRVSYVENSNGNKRFVTEKDIQTGKDGKPLDKEVKNLWGQNTYTFYWLPKTNHFFGREKLGWAYRKQGQEALTIFPLNIYKSQEKSAVEHCIGENKKAQIADIKLMHTIIKSGPPGKYLDMKYIRQAIDNVDWEGESPQEVQERLIDMFVEDNNMIGDSEGMDGQNEGQFKPFQEIPGGLRNEINGYITVMQQASANISRFTGINDELAGLNNNPDLLNGARRLNITYGMNAINYAYEARLTQYQSVFQVIAWYVKDMIERGGASKKVIEDLIGQDRTTSISNIGTLKDHQFFVKINLGMRDQEKQDLANSMMIMEQRGQLSRLERFIIDQSRNLKDASLLLAAVEHKYNKEAEAAAAQRFQQEQALLQQKNQGLVEAEGAKGEAKNQNVYVQADAAAKLMQLQSQQRQQEQQTEAIVKGKLQADRLNAGFMKQTQKDQADKDMVTQQQTAPLV